MGLYDNYEKYFPPFCIKSWFKTCLLGHVWEKLIEREFRVVKHWEIWVIVSVVLLISFPWGNDFTCKSCTIFVLNNGLHYSLKFQTCNNVWILCTGREFSFSRTPLIVQKGKECSKLLHCVCVCVCISVCVCVWERERERERERYLEMSSLWKFPHNQCWVFCFFVIWLSSVYSILIKKSA